MKSNTKSVGAFVCTLNLTLGRLPTTFELLYDFSAKEGTVRKISHILPLLSKRT